MRWPWSGRRETRAYSAHAPFMPAPLPWARAPVAAEEAAVGLVSRMLSLAEASGPLAPAFSAPALADLGRMLMTDGEAIATVEGDGARMRLWFAAAPAEIAGASGDPMRWRYRLEQPAPDGARRRTRRGAATAPRTFSR